MEEGSSDVSFIARYWKEPHKFMPERFLGDWPKDAFVPFSQGIFCLSKNCCDGIFAHEPSAGARACLGRRCEVLRLLERVEC